MSEKKTVGTKYTLEKPLEETSIYEKVTPHIARVTLNRPEVHNALLLPEVAQEFVRKIYMGVDDDEVKVIIVRGAGPSFCTGDDLNRAPYEAWGGSPDYKPPPTLKMLGIRNIDKDLLEYLYCPKTIIAQVHGHTFGQGTLYVMYADLAIAGESARISHAEQRIGFGGILDYPFYLMALGSKKTREWLLTGKTLTAYEAKEWGVVNAVVPDDKLEEETLNWANMVALHSTDGLMIGKFLMRTALEILGVGMQSGAILPIAHALFQGLQWRPDEFNFLKSRMKLGSTTAAFKERERLWAQYGF